MQIGGHGCDYKENKNNEECKIGLRYILSFEICRVKEDCTTNRSQDFLEISGNIDPM